MSAKGQTGRIWLAAASLLIVVVAGAVFVPRPEQRRPGPATPPTSHLQLPALAPGSALPASTPAFSPQGPDLVGRVVSTRGDPLPGARVFIDSARPRVGRGYT